MLVRPEVRSVVEIKTTTPRGESELPPSADPLADPLRLLRLSGVLHCRAEFSAPWGMDLPRIPDCMAVHIVNSGSLYLDIAGQPTRRVNAGGLVIVPHGTRHQLRSEPGTPVTPLTDIPVQLITDRYERMQFGGGGTVTNVSYCGVRFDPAGARRLLQVLPLVIHLDTLVQDDQWLRDTTRFMAREAEATQPGSEAIITRLADIVVVQAIRAWWASSDAKHGWLAALHDRQIGRALATIHRDPSRDWTVASLAGEIGMSRSALAARFSELVGDSVKRYLTEWRMQLARDELMTSPQPLATIIEKYGYQSEAAFSRAFKRVFGVAPGSMRKGMPPA
ncbi:MAG: AraC family transcriptional regulator [Pseudomonadota bacterium]